MILYVIAAPARYVSMIPVTAVLVAPAPRFAAKILQSTAVVVASVRRILNASLRIRFVAAMIAKVPVWPSMQDRVRAVVSSGGVAFLDRPVSTKIVIQYLMMIVKALVCRRLAPFVEESLGSAVV
jgi:hypothetical protein